jgi:hypothetical protein
MLSINLQVSTTSKMKLYGGRLRYRVLRPLADNHTQLSQIPYGLWHLMEMVEGLGVKNTSLVVPSGKALLGLLMDQLQQAQQICIT